jgi:type IV pilus assembly protein PilC
VTDLYVSELCGELSLIVAAGISVSDGLMMLREDDADHRSKKILSSLINTLDAGKPFSQAVYEAQIFPDYLRDTIVLAEKTGRLEGTLKALSQHYARQDRLKRSVSGAVFYPLLLLAIMLVVIGVLVTRVLPIFNDVFHQLGAEMSSLARGLMRIGQALSDFSFAIGLVLAALLLGILLTVLIPQCRAAVSGFFRRRIGGKGVFGRTLSARFASAMSMAVSSGMNTDEALELAALFYGGTKETDRKLKKLRNYLGEGLKTSEALGKAGLFSARESRMLSIGETTGKLSSVLEEIAERGEQNATDDLEALVRKIEPSLVILTSVLVGLILLSVMLPLASIMSSLGG